MSDELIIRYGSPTLAGIKTANLFTYRYNDASTITDEIRSMNHRLVPLGLSIIPLRVFKGKVLLYLYRPDRLEHDFSSTEVAKLLGQFGYVPENPRRCIAQLSKKVKESQQFPHEIGLFLGYPPEDVCGFINQQAEGYKCIGCWKVYGDVKKAEKQFACYKKCTELYCSRWAKGSSMESMINP